MKIKVNNFISKLQNEIDDLKWDFKIHEKKFTLSLNGKKIIFNKCDSDFTVKPNKWFRQAHSEKLSEIGMVAAIILLSKKFKSKVIFYDLGAAFGYFSYIVSAFFKNSQCVLVEGNPLTSLCINKINKKNNFIIKNALLGAYTKKSKFIIDVYKFHDYGISFLKKKQIYFLNSFKNLIKMILNIFGANYTKNKIFVKKINQVTINEILLKKRNKIEIMKIDTEGTQSVFLPPFINDLCSRSIIVLLEFDDKSLMKSYKCSNDSILKLFIKKGYHIVWLDHRSGKGIKKISRVSFKEDYNSLGIFLPPKYFK
jgi:FkbM family methyltransferase